MPYCTYSLSSVVMELAVRAGMDPRTIDVGRLGEQQVRGFTVINAYPCTEALRALSQIFMFDPSNYDGVVHFTPRGDDSIATITEDDMLDDQQDIEQTRFSDGIQIPRVLHLNYYDVNGGLAPNKQSSERGGDHRSTGESSLQSSVVMNAEEAAHAIIINHKLMAEEQRGELKFCLPDKWLYLVPASTVFVQWQNQTVRARISKIVTNDGYQEYALLRDRQSAYTTNLEAFPIYEPTEPPSSVVGPTLILPLDIATLRDSDDTEGLSYYLALTGLLGAWQGALVELSYDGGANYVDSASVSTSAVIGELITPLGDHPQAFPDEVNTCTVRLHTPLAELTQTTFAALLNQFNLALVGDEMIQFRDVDETSEGEWEIGYLVRGRKGTTTAAHAVGERFVLLERTSLVLVRANLTDIGRTLTFRATSFGTSTADAMVVSMFYTGKSQTEREPGYVRVRRDGTNLIVDWQGVGRLGAGASVAHGERFDGYRVTFDDGSHPVITVNTAAQTLTQSVAALGTPITVAVRQLNELTGEGPAIEAIVT